MVVVRGLLGAVAAKIFFGGTAPKLDFPLCRRCVTSGRGKEMIQT